MEGVEGMPGKADAEYNSHACEWRAEMQHCGDNQNLLQHTKRVGELVSSITSQSEDYIRKAQFDPSTTEQMKLQAGVVEGCCVWQPTLDLRWTGETGSSYLCCMEVGTISYYKNKGIRNYYTFIAWK